MPPDGECPARVARVRPFRIGKFAITNAEFAEFVASTGYVTDAEKYGWSFVFESLLSPRQAAVSTEAAATAPWWVRVDGADWRHPRGLDSHIENLQDHPVVQMSWNDAATFCRWYVDGGRLPTEAEWEYAAKGGLENKRYPWGDDMLPEGKHKMNIWQSSVPDEMLPKKNFYLNGEYYLVPDDIGGYGLLPKSEGHQKLLTGKTRGTDPAETKVMRVDQKTFDDPEDSVVTVHLDGIEKIKASIGITHAFYSSGNSEKDGWTGTCPVYEYGPQNNFGMYNMAGNVWEWVEDWWTINHEISWPVTENPRGPATGDKCVLKGGSFICNWLTCPRMRPSGRKGLPPDSGSDSLGFRCAADN